MGGLLAEGAGGATDGSQDTAAVGGSAGIASAGTKRAAPAAEDAAAARKLSRAAEPEEEDDAAEAGGEGEGEEQVPADVEGEAADEGLDSIEDV